MTIPAKLKCNCKPSRANRIAQLNDELRSTGTGGQIVITRGVQSLAGFDCDELLRTLAAFDRFDPDNDPHSEHDFGDMDLWGAELLWKIDYYAPDLMFGSDDPADPSITRRILTVLLAEEY